MAPAAGGTGRAVDGAGPPAETDRMFRRLPRGSAAMAVLWGAFVLMLGGCQAATRRLAAADLRDVQSVCFVPMQPPPLSLAPEPYGGTLAVVGAVMLLPPLVVVGGLLVLCDLPCATARAEQQGNRLEQQLRDQVTWVPTQVFAAHGADRLQSARSGWQVGCETRVTAMPGIANPARTWHMHNWYGPIGDWYAAEPAAPAAAGTIASPPRRLQVAVAVSNYEVYRDHLILHVLIKVVDADTGRVLGRARDIATQAIPEAGNLLADGAARLKRAIATVGTALLDRLLTDVGLLPPSP